jgi:hypothetical protein
MTIVCTIGIVALVSSTVMVSAAHPAFALKNLFRCITDASSGGKLSFQDYVNCYNQQFHGQLGDHPASLSNPDVSVTP